MLIMILIPSCAPLICILIHSKMEPLVTSVMTPVPLVLVDVLFYKMEQSLMLHVTPNNSSMNILLALVILLLLFDIGIANSFIIALPRDITLSLMNYFAKVMVTQTVLYLALIFLLQNNWNIFIDIMIFFEFFSPPLVLFLLPPSIMLVSRMLPTDTLPYSSLYVTVIPCLLMHPSCLLLPGLDKLLLNPFMSSSRISMM